jgi:pyruvate/2-oxoacid:ferredoxin oxidoreductase alpha subunit
MDNGVDRPGDVKDEKTGTLARDAWTAVFRVEALLCQRVFTTPALAPLNPPADARRTNAFGDGVTFKHELDVALLVREAREHAALGERVALLATVDELAVARGELRTLAKERLPVVVHLFAAAGADVAFATEGLHFGVLLSSGVTDSMDLTLVARRAAEDSGTPFIIVHERSAARHLEPVRIPDPALLEAFVGSPAQRVKKATDPAHPVHAKMSERAFAERVPFALASAMRGLESFTGRRHDVIERTAGEGTSVMLVGAGAMGDALVGEAERLRAAGYDVGAVKITALRPFPGPKLVRALARALVVTVLETSDEPLAQSNPLAREVKSAFADALTWAPDYPGVGRLPRIHSGAVTAEEHELEAADLDAIARNMVEGEQGKRLFVYGADPTMKLGRTPANEVAPYPSSRLSMRGHAPDLATANACAELAVTVLEGALALKCRVFVRSREPGPGEGSGAWFDLVAGRERPRGLAALGPVHLVLLDDLRALVAGHPLARVAHGGLVAIPTNETTGEGLFGELPAYVKAIAFDRGVRVLGFAPSSAKDESERRWTTAAAFAGVMLFAFGLATPGGRSGAAARLAIDGSLVEREVAFALRAFGVAAERADEDGKVARRAFEAHVEVSRATLEKDLASINLGRSDARAGALEG